MKLQKRTQLQKSRNLLKGLFPIPYEIRVESGDWNYPISYFGKYENQRWGYYDSNSCWCVSSINCIEDQLEWLWKNNKFSKEAKDFFTGYGFIDKDGDFSLSERFIEILSGVKDGGNSQDEAWRLIKKYGLIPRSYLTYTEDKARSFSSQDDFRIDYFGKSNITQGMLDLAKEFLAHVNIDYQQIGKTWTTPNTNALRDALRQSPLQIGIPVPYDWNQVEVKWDGSYNAEHAVELYAITNDGKYKIFDQYQPALKVLSADYYIPIVTQGVVTVKNPIIVTPIITTETPVIQETLLDKVWKAVRKWIEAHGGITRLGTAAERPQH